MSSTLPTLSLERLPRYAPIVLRLALTAVYVWFGVSQLVNTAAWTGLVPSWASGLFGLSSSMIVQMNGIFEVAAGILLACSIFVRYVALVLAVHLFVITSHLGLTAIGVRDFGLSFATLSLALFGGDEVSFASQTSKK